MSRRHRMIGLGAGLIVILLLAWAGNRLSIGHTSRLTGCIRDGATGGCLAIARWAEQLSWPVRPLREPLWQALKALPAESGNCVITAGNGSWSPWRDEMETEEWAGVQGWVRRGNTLIIITADASGLPAPVSSALFGRSPGAAVAPAVPFQWMESAVPADPEAIVVPITGGHKLEVRKGGKRVAKAPDGWEVAGDGNGSVWHRVPVGNGAIYLIVDDFAWTNAGFDRVANVQALAAVLRREMRGGVLGFDEFRHGHGQVDSLSTLLFRLPGARSFAWIGLILAGMVLVGRNVRMGPPEVYDEPERRTAREYIEAVAYLYERARAAPLAVAAVERRFRQLAHTRGHVTPHAQSLQNEMQKYAASDDRPTDPAQACELVAALVQQRKKLYGS